MKKINLKGILVLSFSELAFWIAQDNTILNLICIIMMIFGLQMLYSENQGSFGKARNYAILYTPVLLGLTLLNPETIDITVHFYLSLIISAIGIVLVILIKNYYVKGLMEIANGAKEFEIENKLSKNIKGYTITQIIQLLLTIMTASIGMFAIIFMMFALTVISVIIVIISVIFTIRILLNAYSLYKNLHNKEVLEA